MLRVTATNARSVKIVTDTVESMALSDKQYELLVLALERARLWELRLSARPVAADVGAGSEELHSVSDDHPHDVAEVINKLHTESLKFPDPKRGASRPASSPVYTSVYNPCNTILTKAMTGFFLVPIGCGSTEVEVDLGAVERLGGSDSGSASAATTPATTPAATPAPVTSDPRDVVAGSDSTVGVDSAAPPCPGLVPFEVLVMARDYGTNQLKDNLWRSVKLRAETHARAARRIGPTPESAPSEPSGPRQWVHEWSDESSDLGLGGVSTAVMNAGRWRRQQREQQQQRQQRQQQQRQQRQLQQDSEMPAAVRDAMLASMARIDAWFMSKFQTSLQTATDPKSVARMIRGMAHNIRPIQCREERIHAVATAVYRLCPRALVLDATVLLWRAGDDKVADALLATAGIGEEEMKERAQSLVFA